MKGFGDQHKSKKKRQKKSKPSQEQIINQAFQFHSQGNISEAAKYYQLFLDKGFSDARVSFDLGVIFYRQGKLEEAKISLQESIKLNPNSANAHSNLGYILQALGKTEEAEVSTRKAIEINPNYEKAYCNLGSILRDLGKLQEAEVSVRKAIEINPNYEKAYCNLGSILRDLGKLQEAEVSVRKAIEINPNDAVAHYNLGIILKDLGKLHEAEVSVRKAIKIKSDFTEAHYNLGKILKDLGKLQEAFDSYLKVIEINPTYPNLYIAITEFLKNIDPSKLNQSKLKNILNLLLEINNVSHQALFNLFNLLYSNELITNLDEIESDFSNKDFIINKKVIINALKKIIFTDIRLENALTKLRKYLCSKITKNKEEISYSELQLIIALGEQCFLNEYIYSLTKEEKSSLKSIIRRCQDNELSESNISILSCYFPLYKLLDQIPSLASFNSNNQSLKELLELQIAEPIKEIELSKDIKKLGSINNEISQKVKCQYEENPYPRWRYDSHQTNQKMSIIQAVNTEINPNYISQSVDNNQLKVLIAGCGTGNQILQTQRYKNAQITAIDLSLSSLSYAQRKINELKIDNVELIQMDIIKVSLLEMKFDIIECGGVLHHMEDPSRGLKALVGVLKKNSFLKLGLYSELARKDIVKARKYIASKNLQANKDSIRNFRKTIFLGKASELNSLSKSSDFYSLSSCLDLCFHTKEHRFTI
ncbi:tetratricopeptide repeat protein, partial [bacterium]|nr:tetratricopeptide repeat protein [bacterium]